MKILIGCWLYQNYTGSECSFYELTTALTSLGHDVSVFAINTGDPLVSKTKNVTFETATGILNKIYDHVIFSHGPVIWNKLKNVKSKNFTNIIRSEVLPHEAPVIDSKITNYVSIRPSIRDFIKQRFNIDSKVIYNPFDTTRFNKSVCDIKRKTKQRVVLFPGSLDYLRIQPVSFLLNMAEDQNYIVRHVGRCDYDVKHPRFETLPSTTDIEKQYADCDIVSGIFLGRTSIEGLLCGKKVYQFDVDDKGNILKHYWHKEDNLDKFNKINVAKEYLNL